MSGVYRLEEEKNIYDSDWTENKAYRIELICGNCGYELFAYVPKGITVGEFLIGKDCQNCLCGNRFLKR